MLRPLYASVALAALLSAMGPAAFAADYDNGLRGRLPLDFEIADEPDPLGFEFGLRYWYSMGAQSASIGADNFSSNDTSHILEGHFRIDDYSTNTFLKGNAGYAFKTDGSYTNPSTTGTIVDGQIGYAGADFGQSWFGDMKNGAGIGGLVGYAFWHDNPDVGRANYTVASSASDVTWSTATGNWSVGYDSTPNSVDIHALRLGLAGKAELGTFADISGELVAIPVGWMTGTMGAYGVSSFGSDPTYIMSSATSVNGFGYGAAAEVMLGIHPTDNMTIRVGGRAQYMQGRFDATYSMVGVTDPVDSEPDGTYDVAPIVTNQNYISTSNPFSLWRVGGLVELTVSF